VEDRATAQNKEQDALIARLAPPSSRLEVENAKLKAELAALRTGAARPPPPMARAATPPPSAALSMSVATAPVARHAPPPPSKAKPSPNIDVPRG